MVQGYLQKNSRSSGGGCSLGSTIGFRAVFSFNGKPCQEGQSFSPCREQPPEFVQRSECASRAYMRRAHLEQWSAYPPKRSYILFEKKFVSGYQFMCIIKDDEGNAVAYRIDWKDVVLLLENPVIKSLRIRYGYGRITQFIVQKREFLSRETFSRRAFNRCDDMSDEMKDRYVEDLIERLETAELDNHAMKLILGDLTKELSRSNQMLEKLNELQSLLKEEQESRKSLERENTKLKEQLQSSGNLSTMGINRTPIRHLSDLSKVPSRILDRKMVRTFREHLPCGGTVRIGSVRGEGPYFPLGVFSSGRASYCFVRKAPTINYRHPLALSCIN